MVRNVVRLLSAAIIGVLFMVQEAHADCMQPATEFDAGTCAAADFFDADRQLNQAYDRVYDALPPDGQATLRASELVWMQRRDKDCIVRLNGTDYINFDCAAEIERQHTLILEKQLAQLHPPVRVSPVPRGPAGNNAVPPGPAVLVVGTGAHGCAVFGGTAAHCQNYPGWAVGRWQPPPAVHNVKVLVVGGGGGGAANFVRGIGGGGGGSGKVVAASVLVNTAPIAVEVGQGGAGSSQFTRGGNLGDASSFGAITASGGAGGLTQGGSASGPGGNNGGGGAGGGSYAQGYEPGAGGAGGTGGKSGDDGEAATDPQNPVAGSPGGVGTLFPDFAIHLAKVTAGAGGAGGTTSGSTGSGCGGGGGGGGGGILLDGAGGTATAGIPGYTTYPCGDDRGAPGGAGQGFGAGGGGSGNGNTDGGGNGAAGLVYVEW